MTTNLGLDTDTIDHSTLQRLAKAGALHGITVTGDPEGWTIIAQVRQTQYPLVGRNDGRTVVRHWRRMETAVKYLRQIGVERFEVDARHFDSEAMRRTNQRPDTAAALKRAHEAADYDRWFREQVAAAIEEADDPNAEWFTWEEVEQRAMEAIERASADE
jgi:hypothetical protein